MIAQKYVRIVLYFLVTFSFLISGCGYRFSVEGMGPKVFGGVAGQDDGPLVPLVIRDLLDRTFYSDLGFKYTKYMRQEFAASSGAKVVYDDGQADFVLEGEIVSVSVPSLSFSTTEARESRVNVVVKVTVKERTTGRVVWSDSATGTAEFFVNQSPDTETNQDQLQFNQVLQDRALEQAGQVVAEILAADFWDARDQGIFEGEPSVGKRSS